MRVHYFIFTLLIFLGVEAHASPPDNRPCVSYSWKELKSKLADKSVSPRWRSECGESMASLHMSYGSADDALDYIQREIRSKVPIEQLQTAFYHAIDGNFQGILGALLKYGISPNASEKGYDSPLIIAIRRGHLEIVRILIKGGGDINYEVSKYESAITTSIEHGNTNVVNLLVEHGANIDKYRQVGQEINLLVLAIKSNNIEMVNLLLHLNFDLNAFDKSGKTPLLYSIDSGATRNMVEYLLNSGANPCHKNSDGENALGLYDRMIAELKFEFNKTWHYRSLFEDACN